MYSGRFPLTSALLTPEKMGTITDQIFNDPLHVAASRAANTVVGGLEGAKIFKVTYITCHTPPVDIIIKEREEKYGLK